MLPNRRNAAPRASAKPLISLVTLVKFAPFSMMSLIASFMEMCIRDRYKIDGLEWPWLTAEQWSRILNALRGFFVYVTFVDPVTNSRKTIKMYPGDRTGEPYWADSSGKPTHYRNCKEMCIRDSSRRVIVRRRTENV